MALIIELKGKKKAYIVHSDDHSDMPNDEILRRLKQAVDNLYQNRSGSYLYKQDPTNRFDPRNRYSLNDITIYEALDHVPCGCFFEYGITVTGIFTSPIDMIKTDPDTKLANIHL